MTEKDWADLFRSRFELRDLVAFVREKLGTQSSDDLPLATLGGAVDEAVRMFAHRRLLDDALFQDVTRRRRGAARIAEHLRSPEPVMERVRVERFHGRQWLERRLDAFLIGNDRGWFVIEAGAGFGKTAFLAHLMRTRSYVGDLDSHLPGTALRNLSAQLLLRFEADSMWVDRLPGIQDVGAFYELLQGVDRRGERLVLVLDPKDEPWAAEEVLPAELPAGVYAVIGQRPGPRLSTRGPLEVARIEGEENVADMQVFAHAAVQALQAAGTLRGSPDSLAEELVKRAQGIWVVLAYVLADLEAGRLDVSEVSAIPQGLRRYYAWHWGRWRDAHAEDWDAWQSAALGVLAATGEPLDLSTICSFAGIEGEARVRRLLDTGWAPFLHRRAEGPTWTLYHQSLREFLHGRGEGEVGEAGTGVLLVELRELTRRAHVRIADQLLARWGGLPAGLPGLRAPEPEGSVGRYGRRHLAMHLVACSRWAEILALYAIAWTDGTTSRDGWFSALEQVGVIESFVAEARMVIRAMLGRKVRFTGAARLLFALLPEANPGEGDPREEILGGGLQVALALASVAALDVATPPEVLALLVRSGQRSLAEAMASARRTVDSHVRARTLALLAHAGGPTEELREEALDALRSVAPGDRAAAFASIADLLDPARRQEAAEQTFHIVLMLRPEGRLRALADLAPHLPRRRLGASVLKAIAEAGSTLWQKVWLGRVLSTILPWLRGKTRAEVVAALRRRVAFEELIGMRDALVHALPVVHSEEGLIDEAAACGLVDDLSNETGHFLTQLREEPAALAGLLLHLPADARPAALDAWAWLGTVERAEVLEILRRRRAVPKRSLEAWSSSLKAEPLSALRTLDRLEIARRPKGLELALDRLHHAAEKPDSWVLRSAVAAAGAAMLEVDHPPAGLVARLASLGRQVDDANERDHVLAAFQVGLGAEARDALDARLARRCRVTRAMFDGWVDWDATLARARLAGFKGRRFEAMFRQLPSDANIEPEGVEMMVEAAWSGGRLADVGRARVLAAIEGLLERAPGLVDGLVTALGPTPPAGWADLVAGRLLDHLDGGATHLSVAIAVSSLSTALSDDAAARMEAVGRHSSSPDVRALLGASYLPRLRAGRELKRGVARVLRELPRLDRSEDWVLALLIAYDDSELSWAEALADMYGPAKAKVPLCAALALRAGDRSEKVHYLVRAVHASFDATPVDGPLLSRWVVPAAVDLGAETTWGFLLAVTRMVAGYPRYRVLAALRQLAPLFLRIGGRPLARRIVAALEHSGRCWP